MIPTLKTKLNKIIWDSDLLSARFALILGSLFWAILLLWPGDLFIPTRATYRLMSQFASEVIWGLAFLTHGIFAITSLFTTCRNKFIFIGDAIWGSLLWTAATIACFASHWQVGIPYAPPAAMSAELSLMLVSWWWTIRWIVFDLQKRERDD